MLARPLIGNRLGVESKTLLSLETGGFPARAEWEVCYI
jgi:hypothetical protein